MTICFSLLLSSSAFGTQCAEAGRLASDPNDLQQHLRHRGGYMRSRSPAVSYGSCSAVQGGKKKEEKGNKTPVTSSKPGKASQA